MEALQTWLGTGAFLLSTMSPLPQLVRTWRTRSAVDFSAASLIVGLAAMALWVGYGTLAGASAMVWANALAAAQTSFILGVKLFDRGRGGADRNSRTPPSATPSVAGEARP